MLELLLLLLLLLLLPLMLRCCCRPLVPAARAVMLHCCKQIHQ